jgi:hypothetical protein
MICIKPFFIRPHAPVNAAVGIVWNTEKRTMLEFRPVEEDFRNVYGNIIFSCYTNNHH